MAESDSDPRNAVDDEDLEDGEIETDEENDEVIEEKTVKPAALEPPAKKPKEDTKKAPDAKPKGEKHKPPAESAAKSKKGSNDSNPKVDDWMSDVQNAIAKALKRDGIVPKSVKLTSKSSKDEKEEVKLVKEGKEAKEAKEAKEEASGSSKSSKHKRKHKTEKDSQRKKSKLADEDAERYTNESEDFDEYEMMNVRGGSPPLHGGQQSQGKMYYDSDASCTSFDSETGDHRRRHRSKRRTNDRSSRRNLRGGNSKRDHKRRRDDSDDENNGHNNNTGGNNSNRSNNNNNQPRKAELCKFYLMECCAKGEKCLYMHGDFPCKFYYLGIKNHNRENCKFSHGKPLTDQLRAVLLKHLETAPKEILGDFPRIARENAINMINAQHQKLLVKFGMEPEPSSNVPNNAQTSKLPSLLDINLGKYQPPPNTDIGLNKKDKPRKSRWCDQRNNDSESSNYSSSQNTNNSGYGAANSSNDNDIKLSTLTDLLTPDEVEKLAKMGIETISQITQLTISQAFELRIDLKLIVELQEKAKQHQQQQSTKASNSTTQSLASSSEHIQNPFSKKPANQVQDIPLKSTSINEKLAELANQDIDMRFLAIPPPAVSDNLDRSKYNKEESDNFNKNTQIEKANEQINAATRESYRHQYLKDAMIDLDDALVSPKLNRERKKDGDDSDDEDRGSLVIEEYESQTEDPQSQSDKASEQNDAPTNSLENPFGSKPRDAYNISSQDSTCEINNLDSAYGSSNKDTQETFYDSQSDKVANSIEDNLPPPMSYAPPSIFRTGVTNKIDVSASVSQYLSEPLSKDSVQKTDSYVTKPDSLDKVVSDAHDDNESMRTTSFYSRQIPETNHPAPQALDEKPSPSLDYDSPSETTPRNSCTSPVHTKQTRKSIYEQSSDDENNQNEDNIRSISDDENDSQTFSLSKDKDMRFSAIFMDSKDSSNGDIDLRLPFKPLANYEPATEIDASIYSHDRIVYEVKEVDIPKPDYSELRKSIPTRENILDPRLRRILRIKDDYTEPETNFPLGGKASPFSSSPFSPPHEPETAHVPIPRVDAVSDPRRQRADPRRPNAHMSSANQNPTPAPVLNNQSTTQPQRSVHLDIQNILLKSSWYTACSSKQKIMVNQQLAIMSTELKKFHANPSENKIFDLKFIIQNPLLQEVLTNLGIFINEDGEFVHLDQQSMDGKDSQPRNAGGNPQGLVDLMSIPLSDIDYLRNQQQQEAQQQAAMINAMGGPRAFLGAPAASQMLGFGSLPGDVIRPGLLGIAPNMNQLNDAYNLMQNTNQNAVFFNRNTGGSGNNSRRTGGSGMRRNQFVRRK